MSKLLSGIGSKISFLRKKKNVSQEKLAELASLHRTYISQLEQGQRNASILTLEKVAKGLDVKIKELL